MKITCDTRQLAAELRLCDRIVPTKSALPILMNVRLEALDSLKIAATDLEIGLTTCCPATVDRPGAITLPSKTLLAVVDQLADGPMTISVDSGKVTVAAGTFRTRLQTLPVEDYPVLPTATPVTGMLAGPDLRRLIGRARYAINEKDPRRILDSALFIMQENTAACVATDGKRLSVSTSACAGEPVRVILPRKTLDVLGPYAAEDVGVSLSDRHIFFRSGDRVLYSRMVDGEYPNYSRMIPQAPPYTVSINRVALAGMLRRVNIASGESSVVYLTVIPGGLSLAASSALVGEADERMEVVYDGPPTTLGVNGVHLLDFLGEAVGEAIDLAFTNAESQLLVSDGPDFFNVVMVSR